MGKKSSAKSKSKSKATNESRAAAVDGDVAYAAARGGHALIEAFEAGQGRSVKSFEGLSPADRSATIEAASRVLQGSTADRDFPHEAHDTLFATGVGTVAASLRHHS